MKLEQLVLIRNLLICPALVVLTLIVLPIAIAVFYKMMSKPLDKLMEVYDRYVAWIADIFKI